MDNTTKSFDETPVNENQETLSHTPEQKEEMSPEAAAQQLYADTYGTDGTSNPVVPEESDSEIAANAGTADFLENYAEFSAKKYYSNKLSDADYYWENDTALRDEYEKQYGENAREEFDKYYEEVADTQRELAQEETDKVILGSGMGAIFYDNENIVETGGSTMEVTLETLGGRQIMGDMWTDATRSARQASVESDTYINDKGEAVELKDDEAFMSWDAAKGIIWSDAHKSEDGRDIVGFQYEDGMDEYSRTRGHLKAIYEGDIPSGEIVSFWDASNSILASNGTNNHWITDIPKSVARTTIGLASDLVIGTAEAMNSLATVFDADNENEFIENSRDFITHMSRFKMSQTDYDKQHMVTWANALDLVGQVAGQLALGGGIAKGVGKLAGSLFKGNRILAAAQAANAAGRGRQAARLFKAYESTVGKPARFASLTAMSLMAGSGIKQEAREAGFSEDMTAGLFLAFLPAMFQASKLSALLDNGISTKAKQGAMRQAIREMVAITDEATMGNNRAKFAWGQKLVGKINDKLSVLANKARLDGKFSGFGSAMANEAMEEEVELAMEEGLKHLWTSIGRITSEDPTKRPKFDTIWDEGYFARMAPEILMSGVGGALGGGMMKLTRMGGVDEDTLPWQGDDKRKLRAIALKGGRDEQIFLQQLKRAYDQGALGSQDYLIERDANGKLKKTPEDRGDSPVPTIAEANYRAMMFQYNYYKAQIGSFSGTFDQFKDQHPDLVEGLDIDKELHERVQENFTALSELYSRSGNVNVAESRNQNRTVENQRPAAAAEARRNQSTANRASAQAEDGVNPTTTTNERVDGVEETTSGNQPISEEAVVRANVLGVSEIEAQEILDREQLMHDMMVGKTVEEDLINATLKSNPAFSMVNGMDETPEEFKKYFGDKGPVEFLNKLHVADAKLRQELSRKYADYVARSNEVKEIVDKANSVEDLDSIMESSHGDKSIPLVPEDIAILRSKMKDVANGMISPDDYTAAATSLYDKYRVNELTTSQFNRDLNMQLATSEDADEEFFSMVDNDTDAFLRYGIYKAIESNIALNDVTRLANLRFSTDIEQFRDNFKRIMRNKEIDYWELGADPNETGIFDRALDQAIRETTNDAEYALSDDTVLAQTIRPLLGKLDEIENNLSENTPRQISDSGVEFYGHDFSTDNDDAPETKDVYLLEKAFKMQNDEIEQISPDFVMFRNKEGAEKLLHSVQARKAQIAALKHLFDSGALQKLRVYNSNTFSNEEYYSPLTQDKYTKFSKYVSGFVLDPIAYALLQSKQNRTSEEEARFSQMGTTYANLFASKEEHPTGLQAQLDAAEQIAQSLINLAEESASGARMAQAYNNSVMNFANTILKSLLGTSFPTNPDLEAFLIEKGILDTTKVDDETTVQTWKDIRVIAKALYDLEPEEKLRVKRHLESLKTDLKFTGGKYVTAFMAADYEEFVKNFKGTSETQSNRQPNPEAPILPTIDQEMVAFNVFAFGAGDTGLITKGHEPNAMFANGSLGTGKTTMILGYAMQAIQNEQDRRTFKEFERGNLTGNLEDYNKVMLAANSEDQRTNMERLAINEFGLRVKQGSGNSFSLAQLLESLTKDDAYDLFKDTSTIVYDEVTFIQALGRQSGETSDFNTIVTAIDKLNERRSRNHLEPLRFIGLGDEKQGGFREGMQPGVENVHIDYNALGKDQTIANVIGPSVYRTPRLDFSFRAYVDELNSFGKQLEAFAKFDPFQSNVANIPTELRSVYGRITNDPRNRMGGVQMVNDANANIYNDEDLIADITDQIKKAKEAEEDFVVGIIDNYTSIEELPPSKLRDLAIANQNNFKVRTIAQAQGGEYDYTLISLPEDFLPKLSEADHFRDRFKFDLLSTMVGRSRYFAKVAISDKVNTNSTSGKVAMAEKELSEEFRKKWKGVRDAAFGDIEAIVVTPNEEIDPEESNDPDTPPTPPSQEDENFLKLKEKVITEDLGKTVIDEKEVTIPNDMGVHVDEFVEELNGISEEFGIDFYNDHEIAEMISQIEEDSRKEDVTADKKLENFKIVSSLKAIREKKNALFSDVANARQAREANGMFGTSEELPNEGQEFNARAKILDQNGLSIFYSRITKAGKAANALNSNELKFYYAADIFGYGNVYDSDQIEMHTKAALGLGPKGESAKKDYDYSIVTFNYKTRDFDGPEGQVAYRMATNNVIVATAKDGVGKKFILGMLPGTWRMDPSSPTAALFNERAKQLDLLQETFTNNVDPVTAGKYANQAKFMTDFESAIPEGSVAGRQASVMDNGKNRDGVPNRKLKLTEEIELTGSVYIETDVTDSIDNIIKATSPGALITTSDYTKNELLEAIDARKDPERYQHVNDMPLQHEEGETRLVKQYTQALEGKNYIDNEALQQMLADNTILKVEGSSKPITKVGDHYIITFRGRGRSIPFITKDKSTYEPFFGFDESGNPIIDIDGEILTEDKELFRMADLLNSYGIDSENVFTNDNVAELPLSDARASLSSMLQYKVETFDKTIGATSRLKVASEFNTKRATTSFDKHKITLNDFIKLMNNRGANVRFSQPLVYTNDNSVSKESGSDAGKVFMFYTHNETAEYDLTDPNVVMGLSKKFYALGKSLESNEAITPETIAEHLGEGIGVMQLDYKYNTLKNLMQYFNKSEQGPMSDFNKLIAPSRSEVNKRLVAFITELSEIFRDNYAQLSPAPTSFSRIKKLKNVNVTTDAEGNPQPVQVLNEKKKQELMQYMDTLKNSSNPLERGAFEHLLRIVQFSTSDSNMGKIGVYKGLPERFPTRIRELFLLSTDEEKLALYNAIKEDATEDEFNALEELRIVSKNDEGQYVFDDERFRAIGTTSRKNEQEITGRLVISNNRPLIFSQNSVITYVPVEEISHFAGKDMNLLDEFYFNVTQFMKLLKHGDAPLSITPEISATTVDILDKLLSDYTNPGTLNKGLRIPPSYTNMTDSDSAYGFLNLGESSDNTDQVGTFLAGNSALGEELLTNVKDISGPGIYTDTNAIAEAIMKAAPDTTNDSDNDDTSKLLSEKLESVTKDLSEQLPSILATISSQTEVKKAKNRAKAAKREVNKILNPYVTFGGRDEDIASLREDAVAKIDQELENTITRINGKKRKKAEKLTLEQLRSGESIIAPELLTALSKAYPKQLKAMQKQLSYLPMAVDIFYPGKILANIEKAIEDIPNETRKSILADIKPTITAIAKEPNINSSASIDAAIKYIEDNNIKIDKTTAAMETAALKALNNFDEHALTDMTKLLRISHHADADTKQLIRKYMTANLTSDTDSIGLKFRIMRALRSEGYVITDPNQMTAVEHLKNLDPTGFATFFAREDVQTLLQKAQDYTIIKLYSGTTDANSVIAEFSNDIQQIMSESMTPQDKQNYLKALLDLAPMQFADGDPALDEVKSIIAQNMATLEREINGGEMETLQTVVEKSSAFEALDPTIKKLVQNGLEHIDMQVLEGNLSVGNVMLALSGKNYQSADYMTEFTKLMTDLASVFSPVDVKTISKFLGKVKREIHNNNNNQC